jgi:hypothetical protein
MRDLNSTFSLLVSRVVVATVASAVEDSRAFLGCPLKNAKSKGLRDRESTRSLELRSEPAVLGAEAEPLDPARPDTSDTDGTVCFYAQNLPPDRYK